VLRKLDIFHENYLNHKSHSHLSWLIFS